MRAILLVHRVGIARSHEGQELVRLFDARPAFLSGDFLPEQLDVGHGSQRHCRKQTRMPAGAPRSIGNWPCKEARCSRGLQMGPS